MLVTCLRSKLIAVTLLVQSILSTPLRARQTIDVDDDDDGLSIDVRDLVMQNLAKTASASWEWGTQCQTRLEVLYPTLSVFSTLTRPLPPSLNMSQFNGEMPVDILNIINPILQRRGSTLPIIEDGSSADPASLGVTVLLAYSTLETLKPTPFKYGQVALDQLDDLLYHVPKTVDGALSHRRESIQLWSDFIYMVPPFLAYFASITSRFEVMTLAYEQIKLYRSYLQDPELKMWKHIVSPTTTRRDEDLGFWSTGNGWVTMGILRVVATLNWTTTLNTDQRNWVEGMKNEMLDWTREILESAFEFQNPQTGLLRNYINDPTTFEDVAGTSLLAASTFRFLTFSKLSSSTVEKSIFARQRIQNVYINTSTGWTSPVVNPRRYSVVIPTNESVHSPEAQAFVLMLDTSFKDWKQLHQQPPKTSSGTTSLKLSIVNVSLFLFVSSFVQSVL